MTDGPFAPKRRTLPASPSLAPEYAALRDLVKQATRGEIDFGPAAAPALTAPSSDASRFDDAALNQAMTDDLERPLRFPSGWYEDATLKGNRSFRLELRAAAFGLVAGIAVLLPITYWLNASDPSRLLVPGPDLASTASRLVAEARGSVTVPADLIDVGLAKSLSVTDLVPDDDIEEALRLVHEGNVLAARTLLATAAGATSPRALFLMAETFDPNMLAAWGTRGVAADPDRARALYAAANALGHDKADGRLDALK